MVSRELHFENDHLSLWRTEVAPGISLNLDGEEIVIGVVEGKAQQINVKELQEPTEVLVLKVKKPKDSPLPSRPID